MGSNDSRDLEALTMILDFKVPQVRLVLSTEIPDQAPVQSGMYSDQDIFICNTDNLPPLALQDVTLHQKDMCEVWAEGFSLNVRRRLKDFTAEISLKSLKITDLLQVKIHFNIRFGSFK